MTMESIRKIPTSLWEVASDKLIDVVLNSANGDRMPSDLSKTILYYWQRDHLATEAGLEKLLQASMLLEPEKTVNAMDELGLHELTKVLRESPRI